MPKPKKTLGALLTQEEETMTETHANPAGFSTAKAKLYDAATWPAQCLSCGHFVAEGEPFAWYAKGITTCRPCYDAGKTPDPIKVAEKVAKQANAPKYSFKKAHGTLTGKAKTKGAAKAATLATYLETAKETHAPDPTHAPDSADFLSLTSAVSQYVGPDEDTESVIAETQKVRGCRVLREHGLPVPPYAVLPGDESGAKALCATGNAFARPCQAKQEDEHGWIESRKVASFEDALALLETVHDADPNAQVMVMPALDAATSAIVTPNTLSVGAGHDAATSGKDAINLSIQVAFPPAWLSKAGIATSPYLEIVDAQCVQLRDGPVPSGAPDFIPQDMLCTQTIVVTPDTFPDLTAFNKTAVAWGSEVGLIVHMPGGSPVSHYAAHCKLNGVAFATTFEPTPGETYAKTADALDVEKYRAAFLEGAATDLRPLGGTRADISGVLAASILAIHQTDLFKTEDGARLVGMAVAGLYYATACACHGETRHCSAIAKKTGKKPQRHVIYEGAWANPLDARRTLPNALALFADHSLWAGAFGGAAWAGATEAALTLWDRIVDVGRNGGKIASVIEAAHALVNMAHNTGWLLNKFLDKKFFDACAQGRPEPFVYVDDSHSIRHATSNLIFRMLRNPERLPLDWAKMRQGRWKHSKTRLVEAKDKAKAAKMKAVDAAKAEFAEKGATLAKAQAVVKGGHVHIQYQWAHEEAYKTLDVAASPSLVKTVNRLPKDTTSLAGSVTPYSTLHAEQNPANKTEWHIYACVGGEKIASVTAHMGGW